MKRCRRMCSVQRSISVSRREAKPALPTRCCRRCEMNSVVMPRCPQGIRHDRDRVNASLLNRTVSPAGRAQSEALSPKTSASRSHRALIGPRRPSPTEHGAVQGSLPNNVWQCHEPLMLKAEANAIHDLWLDAVCRATLIGLPSTPQVKCSYTPDQYSPNAKPNNSSSVGMPYNNPPFSAGRFHTATI